MNIGDDQVQLAADPHVHVYPCHRAAKVLEAGFSNLSALQPGARIVLGLTERRDCSFFESLLQDPEKILPGWRVTPLEDGGSLRLVDDKGADLFLLPGRQVVTRERLEILALGTDARIEDGQPMEEVLEKVSALRALPVLNWAPGKWFFSRGKIVSALLFGSRPDRFFLGDTTLRPLGWPTPLLVRKGLARGFRWIAGSDPLPFPGEEHQAGRYGISLSCSFDEAAPRRSFLQALVDPRTRVAIIGRRGYPWSVARRLRNNQAVRL